MTTQEITLIENESKTVAEQVKSLVIADQPSYERGAAMKISLSGLRKKIKIFFDPMVEKAKASYDTVREQRDKFLKPTMEIEDELKLKLKTYERQKEQEAEEARRKAEEERARKQAEAEAKAKDEAEVFGVDAKEIKVDEIEVEQPLPTIDRVKGLGIRKLWRWKVVDETKIPKQYWMLNEVMLNKEVRDNKEKTSILGIEAYEE